MLNSDRKATGIGAWLEVDGFLAVVYQLKNQCV